MKVLILDPGANGDVQPFVAWAQQLQQCGHETALAAPRRVGDLVIGRVVPFAGLGDGPL
jgi:UDP:flavonoid glycosyltransferase YjiC (YdhE family)